MLLMKKGSLFATWQLLFAHLARREDVLANSEDVLANSEDLFQVVSSGAVNIKPRVAAIDWLLCLHSFKLGFIETVSHIFLRAATTSTSYWAASCPGNR